MELQQMRYVVAVAETSSFTRAAQRCLVVQSALSHQVARLERELGARLFDRTSRRVRLTPAGEAFLPAARQCLDAAERAAAEVAAAIGEVRGRLALGVIPTVAAVDLPAALREFHQRHPDVRIGMRVGSSDAMVEQIREGTLDVALLGLPASAHPRGVGSFELARDELVAVVAPEHPLAADETVDLRQLAAEPFVDFPTGSAGRAQSDQAFAAAGLDRDVAFEVPSAELMVQLVQQRLGVAMLASTYVPRLTGVTTIPVTDAPSRIEYVAWSRTSRTPAATAFLKALDVPADLLAE
ncbi:LysR family transcriptional regulator [Saccharopolyspora hirsuta]|uniref:LysR family transcriptional regulator n=1 Tax=Saccharopolyspora hirsuta TaxID=1837 RepID=A0A5M7CA41_SACHI|nr:LysR family transcriptional regulator [Saccharopolyspora hirsuta]KAA5837317.1 LysR family transcriptional regulator [Saccharopolyspora hirsuta]